MRARRELKQEVPFNSIILLVKHAKGIFAETLSIRPRMMFAGRVDKTVQADYEMIYQHHGIF